MSRVRDDPRNPDPGFAALYSRLPDATDLEPWLALALAARPPVLYLGAGAGRIAVPLARAGVELVLVDAHPGMLARLRERLPDAEVHLGLIEEIDLGRQYDLVIVPSNILYDAGRLRGAARHLAADGRLAFELTNPHWLAAGAGGPFRVPENDGRRVRVEVGYPEGTVQSAEFELVWPEEVEDRLAAEGLALLRMSGHLDAGLEESPTFYVLAGLAP